MIFSPDPNGEAIDGTCAGCAICGNCEHCFPDRDGPTPYGICILDPVFEPFQDDFSKVPVESHVQSLTSRNRKKRDLAITSLAHFMIMGNTEAEAALLAFFKNLGPPSTLKEVHFKKFVLRQFRGYETNPELLEILLDDLEQTKSSNTTRQWFAAILDCLRTAPAHLVEDRVRHLLGNGIFSYRLKKRIESVLDQMWEDEGTFL